MVDTKVEQDPAAPRTPPKKSPKKPTLNYSSTRLSFVPEHHQEVAHRFTLVLCGGGAAALSKRLCLSETNDQYRPKADTAANDDFSEPRVSTRSSESDHSLEEIEASGAAVTPRTSAAVSSIAPRAPTPKASKDQRLLQDLTDKHTTLFIPMALPYGNEGHALCRIRFVPVESWSSSLPQFYDKAHTRDHAVLLLFQRDAEGDLPMVDAAIQEFRARIAELNFHSTCQPAVMVLSVNADEADEEKLQDFARSSKLRTGAPVRVVPACDDSEDGLISTVTDIAETLHKQRARMSNWSRGALEEHHSKKTTSSVCTLL